MHPAVKRESDQACKEREAFEAKRDEELQRLPEEFRADVAWLAWERGHSSGYGEVLMCLDDLISRLEKPIKKYTRRAIVKRVEELEATISNLRDLCERVADGIECRWLGGMDREALLSELRSASEEK